MDKTLNPNIICENILLEKIEFQRKADVSEELIKVEKFDLNNFVFDTKLGKSINKDKTKLVVRLQMEIKDKKDEIRISCAMVGVFLQFEKGSMTLEEYSNFNAPAMILPYLRQMISDVTLKASLIPIILPPLNLHQLINPEKALEIK